MDTQFIGENLAPGKLGHFFILLSFIGAIFSAFSYFRAAGTEQKDLKASRGWLLMGRNSFIIHSVSIIAVFICLYYIISNHLFEYYYAYDHSDKSLPMKYLLSCFWEGSEGSFLLWAFWNAVLGLVVMARGKTLESRTMAIVALVQVAIGSTVLGFYIGDSIAIGSSPFILLREKMQGAPIFAQANYLDFIKDGDGLNETLQNYWMTIHPPVLFLGFASTLIPFAYCIAALWKGDYQSFVRPTLTWSLFSGAALGTGIMMGGAWAYESLNFGGYWAWDPVENASLVPWLTLIAGLHTLLIYKATKRSIIITFVLLLLTHLLIWYSTFLTRTGILGDTSVHAFTGEGSSLTYHLLTIIGVLLLISKWLIIKRWKAMPRVKTEEAVSSREFWMFIGSFVLLLSAIQISISTSIPVWSPLAKWITGKDIAPPVDPVQHYNSIQLWVAVVVALLSAAILYLKFKQTDGKTVLRRLGLTAAIGLAFTILVSLTQKIGTDSSRILENIPYLLFLFSCCFAIVANIWYAAAIQKAKLKAIGAPVAHLGFGMSLLGILLSSYNKEVISLNTTGVEIGFDKGSAQANRKENRENIILPIGIPVAMGEYFATYMGDSAINETHQYYRVDYQRREPGAKTASEKFTLYPELVKPKHSDNFTANPDSKHYLTRDIFTYVNGVSNKKGQDKYIKHTIKTGDSIFLTGGYMVLKGIRVVNNENFSGEGGKLDVAADLTVYDLKGEVARLEPLYSINNNIQGGTEDTLSQMNLFVRFTQIVPDKGAAELEVKQISPENDYIVLKAIVFPYINVLWAGVIVMVLGFLMSLAHRFSQKEIKQDIPSAE
ncbi:MAG: cytochrome c biogenesis protein CcsA [Flavipsychrobacter sp.]|nr:cytochrome c biogenesis protein CcsA [Flavipsychrobacter sp.]